MTDMIFARFSIFSFLLLGGILIAAPKRPAVTASSDYLSPELRGQVASLK